jgi:hypothetical protein
MTSVESQEMPSIVLASRSMNETALAAGFEVRLPEIEPSKFERERRAFLRLLPELLTSHRGKYVAVHEEQVVDAGEDQAEVALRVLRRIGSVEIYVHLVSDEPDPVFRSGVVREIRRAGNAS